MNTEEKLTQKLTPSRYTSLTRFAISALISIKEAFIQHLLCVQKPGIRITETKGQVSRASPFEPTFYRRMQSICLIKKKKRKKLDLGPYTFSIRQAKRTGAEGVDLWQDYNKIKFLWPGVSSPFSALSALNQKRTGAISPWQDCPLLLGPWTALLDCTPPAPLS